MSSLADTKEKLGWYAMRWKIETFHKILKSGCKSEESRLRTAERLTNLVTIFCILSWRIFWMTMLKRDVPSSNPMVALVRQKYIPENVDNLVLVDPDSPSSGILQSYTIHTCNFIVIRLKFLLLRRSKEA